MNETTEVKPVAPETVVPETTAVPVAAAVPVVETTAVPTSPPNKTYLVTVQRRFEAGDDLDARRRAREILQSMSLIDNTGTVVMQLPEGDSIKFQEVSKSGPPRKVEL
jgi:hypothetical protein